MCGPQRSRGVYFLTIAAASGLMTAGARVATGIPYRLADRSVVEHQDAISYGGSHRDAQTPSDGSG